MEYSVGSLADLISGSNTPNKPKVIKKAFKRSREVENTDDNVQVENKRVKKEGKSSNIKKSFTKDKLKKEARNQKNGNVKLKKKVKESSTEESNKPGNANSDDIKIEKVKLETTSYNAVSDTAVTEVFTPKKKRVNMNKQNAEKRIEAKIKQEEKVRDPEELARTVYVGNVPISCDKKKVKKHFKKYGKIESIRIRGIPVANLKTPKKVAAIKKEFNPNRSNVFCYIRFEDKESAQKAEAENGVLFEEHHLRVHTCASKDKPDETRAIFVGNLSFNAVEDELWKLFESCGPISYVRIIRDPRTGMGKGFGYVNFMDSDAVQLALEMENIKLSDRELRISLCNLNTAKKNKKNKNRKKISQPGQQKIRHKFKKEENTADASEKKVKQINGEFQGTKFADKNKKRKVNKGLLEKKKLVKKIAPKPK